MTERRLASRSSGQGAYSPEAPKLVTSPLSFSIFHTKCGETDYTQQTLCVKCFLIHYNACPERNHWCSLQLDFLSRKRLLKMVLEWWLTP